MTTNHRSRHRRNDREKRIAKLKQHVEGIAKGEMLAWDSDTLSPEEREQFWRQVVEYETAPLTDHFQQLTEAGLELPEPNALDDETLSSILREMIGALARIRVFISQTDHLSDRELYTLLWHDVLRDEIPMLPGALDAVWH